MYAHEHETPLKSNHGKNPSFEIPVILKHVWIKIIVAQLAGIATLFQTPHLITI
jgi:hypothetical protein